MALTLPESAFVGVDLSGVQIEEGQARVRTLGLKNIELKQASILDVGPEMGKFDYIICHEVYSWVPNAVQDKILDICQKNLTPHGIAYVSYNTYPGWHMRGMIRDMLSYHARQFTEASVKVRQARNLLDFLGKAVGSENSPYGMLVRQELEAFRRSSDTYLYHEHLEEVNEPIYFYQFAERAAAKGLKYLADVDLRAMTASNYPLEIANVLQMLAPDLVHLEQYMDFIRNHMFRQTLLCHKGLNPNYALRGESLKVFHVASPVKPEKDKPDLLSKEPEKFETPDGITLSSRDPIVKSAMVCLSEIWPEPIPFTTLLGRARERLGEAADADPVKDAQTLGQAFLSFYTSASTSLLELYLTPPRFAAKVSEKPVASPLVRLQAEKEQHGTNLRHETVYFGEFESHILRHLDGTRDFNALVDLICKLADNGEIRIEKEEEPITGELQRRDFIVETLRRQLETFSRSALLVG